MCSKLSNFKTVPLLMSHSRYKVLYSKSQGHMHSMLCRTLKYVYVCQAVVILQAWALFTSYIRVRVPAKYLKIMTQSGAEKKNLIMFLFYYSFTGCVSESGDFATLFFSGSATLGRMTLSPFCCHL